MGQDKVPALDELLSPKHVKLVFRFKLIACALTFSFFMYVFKRKEYVSTVLRERCIEECDSCDDVYVFDPSDLDNNNIFGVSVGSINSASGVVERTPYNQSVILTAKWESCGYSALNKFTFPRQVKNAESSAVFPFFGYPFEVAGVPLKPLVRLDPNLGFYGTPVWDRDDIGRNTSSGEPLGVIASVYITGRMTLDEPESDPCFKFRCEALSYFSNSEIQDIVNFEILSYPTLLVLESSVSPGNIKTVASISVRDSGVSASCSATIWGTLVPIFSVASGVTVATTSRCTIYTTWLQAISLSLSPAGGVNAAFALLPLVLHKGRPIIEKYLGIKIYSKGELELKTLNQG